MPFDGIDLTPKQRREILINVLEHPLVKWEWDYNIVKNECGTAGCAIGLATTIWGDEPFGIKKWKYSDFYVFNAKKIGEFFGISTKMANLVFDEPSTYNSYGYYENVTPQMVAEKLKKCKDRKVKSRNKV